MKKQNACDMCRFTYEVTMCRVMKMATKHPNCQEVHKASYVMHAKFRKVRVRYPSPLSISNFENKTKPSDGFCL